MDRRSFFKSMVGGVAAAAAVRTFPFRVFSFPSEIVVPQVLLNLGDVISFGGCFQINPRTGKELPYLKQFVVTKDYRRGDQEMCIHPHPLHFGPFQNVSGRPDVSRAIVAIQRPTGGFEKLQSDFAVRIA